MTTDAEKAVPKRGPGRPALPVTKVAISIRLDAGLIEAFKRAGEGWQTRMNKALSEYAKANGLSVSEPSRTVRG